MRRYSDPIEVRTVLEEEQEEQEEQERQEHEQERQERQERQVGPEAFIWCGRLYVVRRVLAHWRQRRSWWRDALDPVPGQPTGIDVASREQHVWRVEASRGQAYGVGVFDLTSDGAQGADADWRLVGVAD